MVTLVPFYISPVVILFSRLPFPQRKYTTYHVFKSETIHVKDDTGCFDGLMDNDTRCLHDVHGQKLNHFSGLIFLVMEVDIDEAKNRQ